MTATRIPAIESSDERAADNIPTKSDAVMDTDGDFQMTRPGAVDDKVSRNERDLLPGMLFELLIHIDKIL